MVEIKEVLYVDMVYTPRQGRDIVFCIRLPEELANLKFILFQEINKHTPELSELNKKNSKPGRLENYLAGLDGDYHAISGPSEWYTAPQHKCDAGQIFEEVPEFFREF